MAAILDGLNEDKPPPVKPCVRKPSQKQAECAKAKAAAASSSKGTGKGTQAAIPAQPAAASDAPKPALANTRKDVHSRAYKKARKEALKAGKSPEECSRLACKAGKDAAETWDLHHKSIFLNLEPK